MSAKVEKITVERVFNIGNYQTIRFGMEVTPDPMAVDDIPMVKDCYERCLYAVEASFNAIMEERQQNKQQFQKYH